MRTGSTHHIASMAIQHMALIRRGQKLNLRFRTQDAMHLTLQLMNEQWEGGQHEHKWVRGMADDGPFEACDVTGCFAQRAVEPDWRESDLDKVEAWERGINADDYTSRELSALMYRVRQEER